MALITEASAVSFGARDCLLAGLLPRVFARGWPLWQVGDILGCHSSSRKDTCGARNPIFEDFVTISGSHFGLLLSMKFKQLFLSGFVSRAFCAPVFESKSGHSGLQKPCFIVESIAKVEFSQKLEFWWFQTYFLCFLMPLGTLLMNSGTLEGGLKFSYFQV